MNNTLHLYNHDRVQVAAHRGVAGVNIPCNTIPAFDIALRGGAAILEMDLFKSLDGEIFIFHTGKEPFQLDRHIDLTRMTSEEIRKLRLVNVDFNETEHGLNTFDEVLEHMKNRCILNLDRCGAFIPDVIKQVERHGMKEQILLKNVYAYLHGKRYSQRAYRVHEHQLHGGRTGVLDRKCSGDPARVHRGYAQKGAYAVGKCRSLQL